MTHGRDHDERQQKAGRSRANNTPRSDDEDSGLEASLVAEGGGGARPRAGMIGLGPGNGSEVAPTRQAAWRERIRHRIERELGRTAAGTDGRDRDTRTRPVEREELDEAAREADRAVTEHAPSHEST